MNNRYLFEQTEVEEITNRFGQAFYEKVLRDLETCAAKWGLSDYQLIPSFSANLVFRCRSERFGSAVLKIENPSFDTLKSEYQALRHYQGRRFCRVFDVDLENGVLLEEGLEPGTPLRDDPSLDKRLEVFSSLYKDLHTAPLESAKFPTYIGWVERITQYMGTRPECWELNDYMKRAYEICLEVAALYPRESLLHGDFHHDNILLGRQGEYVVIDPKGVVGDPVFDVPRFILNEFEDEMSPGLFRKINDIIYTFEKNLAIPEDILRKCLFVEATMAACWSVEDGASAEEYVKLVGKVAFAEVLLEGQDIR